MFYKLEKKDVHNLLRILANATIKGSDAQKVVVVSNVFRSSKTEPYYQLDDQMREWLLDTVDNFEIKGADATAIVDIQQALTHPTKDLLKAAPEKVEDPPKTGPAPKNQKK